MAVGDIRGQRQRLVPARLPRHPSAGAPTASTYRRPLLGTGFCGAYTTFSTMQVEILAMLEHHRYGLAAGYAAASIAAGYLAVWVATASVRRVRVIA